MDRTFGGSSTGRFERKSAHGSIPPGKGEKVGWAPAMASISITTLSALRRSVSSLLPWSGEQLTSGTSRARPDQRLHRRARFHTGERSANEGCTGGEPK